MTLRWRKESFGHVARTKLDVVVVSQDPESGDWDVCIYGKQVFKDYGVGGAIGFHGCRPTFEEAKQLAAEKMALLQPEPKIYATSYCNHGHYVLTGKPVNHECRVIPPAALQAEMAGNYAEAIELMVMK
jgi:hypothetical protein